MPKKLQGQCGIGFLCTFFYIVLLQTEIKLESLGSPRCPTVPSFLGSSHPSWISPHSGHCTRLRPEQTLLCLLLHLSLPHRMAKSRLHFLIIKTSTNVKLPTLSASNKVTKGVANNSSHPLTQPLCSLQKIFNFFFKEGSPSQLKLDFFKDNRGSYPLDIFFSSFLRTLIYLLIPL